jgi:uncharacterized Zn-finger protein
MFNFQKNHTKSFSGSGLSYQSPLETLHVTSKKVACSGGSKSLGHPLVYLDMGQKNYVTCPYCSKYFTIKQKEKIASSLEYNNK